MTRAADLERRRADLIARSARLRVEFLRDAAVIAARLSFVDRLRAIQRSGLLRLGLGAVAALLAFKQPRRLMRIAARIAPLYPWIKPLVARWWRSRREGVSSPP
jgi:hypothetical protein